MRYILHQRLKMMTGKEKTKLKEKDGVMMEKDKKKYFLKNMKEEVEKIK